MIDNKINKYETGIVTCRLKGFYKVFSNGEIIKCVISSTLRKNLIYPTADKNSRRVRVIDVKKIKTVDPVAIGDIVEFRLSEDNTGMIHNVQPRENKYCREAAGGRNKEQVIASNIDSICLCVSPAKPPTHFRMVDRYLVEAENSEINIFLVATKMDLDEDNEFEKILKIYEKIGYKVIRTSTMEKFGIEEFQNAIKNKKNVLVGKSGVGKSSLLNTIEPDLGIRVKPVSEKTGKGKHTTTHLEMFPIKIGGFVIDTPGIKELALFGVFKEDIGFCFPEIKKLLGTCRFKYTCRHHHEPDCEIKKAVETGEISQMRYESYLKLMDL